jgi:hypothetical protein
MLNYYIFTLLKVSASRLYSDPPAGFSKGSGNCNKKSF